MKALLPFIFAGLLLANSCATKQEIQKEINPNEVVLIPKSQVEKTVKEANKNEEEGWEEFEGNQILKGELYTSKGAILGIGGVFISEDYEVDASKQKPKLRPLVGKKLEVKGDVYIYHCGTLEQCLTEGYMKWLRNVEYVKVIE
ncbi:MAG: hypothetical protein AB8B69_07545 [Chitinophagales bacterium]